MNQPKYPSTDEWRICDTYTHTHTHTHTHTEEYYSAMKSNKILPVCHKMNESRGNYVKWNKSERERQTLCDFIYKWNLTKTNEQS